MSFIVNPKLISLLLHKQFKITDYTKDVVDWKDFSQAKIVNMTVNEARDLAIKKVLPSNKIGDEVGARFEDGKVILPEEFHDVWAAMSEGGWIAMTEEMDLGGSGMPNLLAAACKLYLTGANFAFMMYPGLACEAGNLISENDIKGLSIDARRTIIQKLYDGTYGGTMCLTEPQAGSDVGLLETVAVKNEDGTYTLTGGKIFITNGDSDLTENIIHPVLARIEGAPKGTKGISLFMVPKFQIGTSESNRVKCTGIEKKMGIHGNGTCTMSFDGAKGWLIGEENKGMRLMFSMMNRARHMVAIQGVASASAAYNYALEYAKTRIQGRKLEDFANHDADAVAIINHPDVRRMLMTMKSYVEGMIGLILYIAYCEDKALACSHDEDVERDKWEGLVNILTPVAKGFCTDSALDVCNMAMQVFGGVGYTKEYPIEQLVRDVRITSIYEGTNGIQSMDFLFRQMGLKDGANAMNLIGVINETINKATFSKDKQLGYLSDLLKGYVDDFAKVSMELPSKGIPIMAAQSWPFMNVAGHILCGWQLLEKAIVGTKLDISTALFYFENIMPLAAGRLNAIRNGNSLLSEIENFED